LYDPVIYKKQGSLGINSSVFYKFSLAMKTVVIKRMTHNGELRLMLHFKYDPELVNLAKQVEGMQ
jgi:hypothetical protein